MCTKCTGIYTLNGLHENCFTCCWRLIFLMFPTSDDFTALWDFHWIRITSPSPGDWLTVRSRMLMKFFLFDENWSLVMWRFALNPFSLSSYQLYMKAIIRIGSKSYFKHLTSLPRRIVWLWLNEFVSFIILWRDHICW